MKLTPIFLLLNRKEIDNWQSKIKEITITHAQVTGFLAGIE